MSPSKLTLQFVRRMTNPDGSFAGVVDSSLNVEELEKFFSSLDLGKSGNRVAGRHGRHSAARAAARIRQAAGFAGMSTIIRRCSSHLAESPAGTYWNNAAKPGRFDGISRLMSYRKVAGIPLIAVVGLAKADIFRQADATLENTSLPEAF